MKLTVLTGDIVDSTQMAPDMLEDVMRVLEQSHHDLATWPDVTSYFARRGGDGWQIVLNGTGYDLRAALFIRASLTARHPGSATRIALATGAGDMGGQSDPNRGQGPAFIASGRLLDRLKSRNQMAHASGGAHAACTALADYISQNWTQAQARALREMLPPLSGPRAQAAEKLGISRQSVNDALWAAGFPAIERALTDWETPNHEAD